MTTASTGGELLQVAARAQCAGGSLTGLPPHRFEYWCRPVWAYLCACGVSGGTIARLAGQSIHIIVRPSDPLTSSISPILSTYVHCGYQGDHGGGERTFVFRHAARAAQHGARGTYCASTRGWFNLACLGGGTPPRYPMNIPYKATIPPSASKSYRPFDPLHRKRTVRHATGTAPPRAYRQ